MKKLQKFTNDSLIRASLIGRLKLKHSTDRKVRIIEELGVLHGDARIDIAVVNGLIHGYEIKSDHDSLKRLPEQILFFSTVFDKITLVVGKAHLYRAINLIPDCWGIILAKVGSNQKLVFSQIRKARPNKDQSSISMVRLLWRSEALSILKEFGAAQGFYSKPKENIYNKLVEILDKKNLKFRVRNVVLAREGWRSGRPLVPNGD